MFFTLKEVAKMVGLSPSTVSEYRGPANQMT